MAEFSLNIDEIKVNSEDLDIKHDNTKEFKKNNNESTFEGRKTVGELKKITNPDELYYNKYYAWSKIHEEMNINMDVEDPPKNIEVYYIFDPSGAERISKVKEIIRNNKDKDKPLTGFVGIGCSYSGKWFGGYARNKTGRNYCLNAHNSILKQLNEIRDIKFDCKDYKELEFDGCLIYCDPPYKETTKYKNYE